MSDSPLDVKPSAAYTFLVTDIRGYTAFAAERGDVAAAHLSELFLGICREVVSEQGGEVFGSAGDQALAAFPSSHAALHAAVAVQDRLRHESEKRPDLPLRPGIGLETGEAVAMGNDYRGNAVNVAARLCSIAHSGEILAGQTVVGVARLVEGIEAIDRGEVALKGLPAPVRVFQVAKFGALPRNLPPLAPVVLAHPNNLPDDPTPFIGRRVDLAHVATMLAQPQVRLVTITGPGGTGKTRLALQLGNTLLHDFDHGVFFVSLAPLRDADLVPSAIREALGVKEDPEVDAFTAVSNYLRERQVLLLLDNFEHLLDACDTVSHLLESCGQLHMLVTSRTPLRLRREHEYPLAPLPIPREMSEAPESLSQIDSVALFVDRAQAVLPSFTLNSENGRAVAEICSRLDGLPLAIELAAARIRMFRPQALRDRLQNRLDLLTGGARDLPERHRTLRGAIEWSYSLLDKDEQWLFALLSIFSGGWNLDAAEAICASVNEACPSVLEGLTSLLEKNLVRQVDSEVPGETRFDMLSTIREFGCDVLRTRGEEETVTSAHTAYFLKLAEQAHPELTRGNVADWLNRLEADHENLRAVLQRLLQERDVTHGFFLVNHLWMFWGLRSHLREGRDWIEEFLALPAQEDQRLRAAALNALGVLTNLQTDYDVTRKALEESARLFRQYGGEVGLADALANLGAMHRELGDFEDARRLWKEALALRRKKGDPWSVAKSLIALGMLERDTGHFERSRHLLVEGLGLREQINDAWGMADGLLELALLERAEGNDQEAQRLTRESLKRFMTLQDEFSIVQCLANLARLEAVESPQRAAVLFAAASSGLKTLGTPLGPKEAEEHEKALAKTRQDLPSDVWDSAWAEGSRMTLNEAAAFALRDVEGA